LAVGSGLVLLDSLLRSVIEVHFLTELWSVVEVLRLPVGEVEKIGSWLKFAKLLITAAAVVAAVVVVVVVVEASLELRLLHVVLILKVRLTRVTTEILTRLALKAAAAAVVHHVAVVVAAW
jgi:hypothetical protein